MKKTIFVLLLFCITCHLFCDRDNYLGLSFGPISFEESSLSGFMNIGVRCHSFDKDNMFKAFTVDAYFANTWHIFQDKDDIEYVQYAMLAEYTPAYYYEINETVNVVLYGGGGIGVGVSKLDHAPTETIPLAGLTAGTKLNIWRFGLDCYYKKVFGEHSDLNVNFEGGGVGLSYKI